MQMKLFLLSFLETKISKLRNSKFLKQSKFPGGIFPFLSHFWQSKFWGKRNKVKFLFASLLKQVVVNISCHSTKAVFQGYLPVCHTRMLPIKAPLIALVILTLIITLRILLLIYKLNFSGYIFTRENMGLWWIIESKHEMDW